ncbi:MAG: MptD family putative ECF transporter S component [Bifidobacteriaceae bacterium]|nr:MptD family putative ECF transporter S component [Bifidobacteriaceae bacterium]
MNRLFSAKDLINIGIFTVLYMVVLAVFGQLGALVPILQVLGPLYIPLLGGIPFMLFATRVRHFGMVTVMGWLTGLLVLATGQSYWVALFAIVLAPAADAVLRLGDYRQPVWLVLGYAIFSEMLIGTVVPLFIARDAFLERLGRRHDQGWIDSLVALTPSWVFWVMIAELAVGAAAGAYLGRATLRKHFERAGVA